MPSIFGRTLRHLREKFELSTNKLAAVSGADRTVLGRIEIGDREPSEDIIKKIAPVLGMSAPALMMETFEDIFGPGFEKYVLLWLDQRRKNMKKRSSPEHWHGMSHTELDLAVARLLSEQGYLEDSNVSVDGVEMDMRIRKGDWSAVVEIEASPNPTLGSRIRQLDLKRQMAEADEAFFVALGGFSPEAIDLAEPLPIRLIDAAALSNAPEALAPKG